MKTFRIAFVQEGKKEISNEKKKIKASYFNSYKSP